MSFSLNDYKSILKYDATQWQSHINDRNVYIVCDNDIASLTHNDVHLKSVIILNGATFARLFQTVFTSMALKNEVSLARDVQTTLFTHNIDRFVKDFTKVKPIGRGGFGRVYEATNLIDLFKYAIKKIVFKRKHLNKNNYTQMLTEFRILASLNHGNVVRYNTAWFENESPRHDEESKSDEENRFDSSCSERSSNASKSNFDSVAVLGSVSNSNFSYISDYSGLQIGQSLPDTESSRNSSSRQSSSRSHSDHSSRSSAQHTSSIANISHGAMEVFVRNKPELGKHLVLYIQMELCDDNLKDWLDARNKVPGPLTDCDRKTARCLGRQLLSGINYIHGNNVVHRDIKPANLFLVRHKTGSDYEFQLKIGDFGLAKSLLYNGNDDSFSPRMSANVGTGFYTAPEVIRHGSRYVEYNHKCDLYSVGIILLEMMTKFTTISELSFTIRDMKTNGRNDYLSLKWPIEAPYVVDLLSTEVVKRPSAEYILRKTLAFRDCTKDVESSVHELYNQSQREVTAMRIANEELTVANRKLTEEKRRLEDENRRLKETIESRRLM